MAISIAYQVARRSRLRVVVLDKARVSVRDRQAVRLRSPDSATPRPSRFRLSRDANAVFRNWAAYTGLHPPRAEYRMSGVPWILGNEPTELVRDRDRMLAEGVDSVVIGPEELVERLPALSACQEPFDLTGATEHEHRNGEAFLLEQDSGYFDATAALEDGEAARASMFVCAPKSPTC